jgi:biotin carboxyl carrier protein
MKITTNSKIYEVALSSKDAKINGEPFQADVKMIDPATFHIVAANRSFRAEVIAFNAAEKKCVLKINDNIYQLEIQDRYSELLSQLGIDTVNAKKVSELKAPMPGMVLQIFVKEGDPVKKGDSLLTLEAMKMENILKAPADGTIRSIKAVLGNKVEKNQVMISFE